jgi:hypothetical protein
MISWIRSISINGDRQLGLLFLHPLEDLELRRSFYDKSKWAKIATLSRCDTFHFLSFPSQGSENGLFLCFAWAISGAFPAL